LKKIDVYFETSAKRAFAGALDWPGWCRSGRDEATALQALLDYGPRYASAIRSAGLGFQAPAELSALVVGERLKGDSTTDFSAPGIAPTRDSNPVSVADLRRFQSLLKACWRTFDAAAASAKDKSLLSGPRGGGRDREKIIEHVLGADQAYLSRLGLKFHVTADAPLDKQLNDCRQAMLEGLTSAAHGELPARGPRGGLHWSPRYLVRRVAWHVLDHAWEIEDRLE
jgi:hypothetical protein